jgi:hypothetical protein
MEASHPSRRIDAAPSSKTPGQIPARAGRRGRRDIVDAGGAPGLAAQQPRQRHPAAGPQSESLDRLVAIDRAGRKVAAVITDQRRQRVSVDPDCGASGVTGESRKRVSAVGTMRCHHERFAKMVSVILLGSDARNQPMEANATHLRQDRTLSAQLQQKFYGRGFSTKLPFS